MVAGPLERAPDALTPSGAFGCAAPQLSSDLPLPASSGAALPARSLSTLAARAAAGLVPVLAALLAAPMPAKAQSPYVTVEFAGRSYRVVEFGGVEVKVRLDPRFGTPGSVLLPKP